MANAVELQSGTHPNRWDTDGDGLADGAEREAGGDPLEFYNGRAATIRLVDGGRFRAVAGKVCLQPIRVAITDAAGQPLAHAPVVFRVAAGSARLSRRPAPGAPEVNEVRLIANDRGEVSPPSTMVLVRAPAVAGEVALIEVHANETVAIATFEAVAALPPRPPTDLTVTENTDGTVTFTWTGYPEGVETVRFEVETRPAEWTLFAELPVAQLPMSDTATGRYTLTLPRP